MIDDRINYEAIVRSIGCDTCCLVNAGYCGECDPDTVSNYRPFSGSIQEKYINERAGEITYAEYLRFCNNRLY